MKNAFWPSICVLATVVACRPSNRTASHSDGADQAQTGGAASDVNQSPEDFANGIQLSLMGDLASNGQSNDVNVSYSKSPLDACRQEADCVYTPPVNQPPGLIPFYLYTSSRSWSTGYGNIYYTYQVSENIPIFLVTRTDGNGMVRLNACKDDKSDNQSGDSFFLTSDHPGCDGLGFRRVKLDSFIYRTAVMPGMSAVCREGTSPYRAYADAKGCGSNTVLGYAFPIPGKQSIYPLPTIGQIVLNPVKDSGTTKIIPNQDFVLTTFDNATSKPNYTATYRSDAKGILKTRHLAYVNGLQYKLCLGGQAAFRFDGISMYVRFFSGTDEQCVRGRFSMASETVIDNAMVKLPAEYSINLYTLIKDKTYCPGDPMFVADLNFAVPQTSGLSIFDKNYLYALAINAAFKSSKLDVCKNNLSTVSGKVVNAESSEPIQGATISVTFSDAKGRTATEGYTTDAQGAYASRKVSLMRGQSVQVCASARDFPMVCASTALSGSTEANTLDLKLVKNAEPVGQATLDSTADASGVFPNSSILNVLALDPDDTTKPVTVRLSATVSAVNSKTCQRTVTNFTKSLVVNQKMPDQCDIYSYRFPGICSQNVGLSTSLQDLGLPVGSFGLNVAVFNAPRATQDVASGSYVDLQGSPIAINTAPPQPDPFCGAITYTVPSTFPKDPVKIQVSRVLKDKAETLPLRVCEDTAKGAMNTAPGTSTNPLTCFVEPGKVFAPAGCADLSLPFTLGLGGKEVAVTGLKTGTSYLSFLMPDTSRVQNSNPVQFKTTGTPPPVVVDNGSVSSSAIQQATGDVDVTIARTKSCLKFSATVSVSCTTKKPFSGKQTLDFSVGDASKTASFKVGTGNSGKSCTISVTTNPAVTISNTTLKLTR